MKNTRTVNSIKNSFTSILTYIITMLMGFACQAIFIRTLNVEYNGIKGLFSNILSMLNIAELGFGSAIIYNLYKPISEKDESKIRTLVKFYKKVYMCVATVILLMGIVLLPVIPQIVGNVTVNENVRLLFILYLLSTVVSYLFTYKRAILYADQKNYITRLFNSLFVVIRNIVQIVVLLMFKNFIVFLLVQIILPIIENITINLYINKRYPYIKNLSDADKISEETKKDILTKVKGLLFHKVGMFIVTGTDNIIISMSKGLGIVTVGLYANYNMIISQVNSLFHSVITSLIASVGNLLIERNKEDSRKIYKSMLLLNSWMYCFCTTSILCLIEPFIKIWIGEEFLLSRFVLVILLINFYMQGLRSTSATFKEAAGIFYEDRYIPIIEAIVNIVASIFFVKIWGLAGVFLGTITSTMIIFLYSYPKFVYKNVLDGKISEYFKIHIFHIVITSIICALTFEISQFIVFENAFISIILNGILCMIFPNVLYFICVYRKPEFEFYKEKIIRFMVNKKIINNKP